VHEGFAMARDGIAHHVTVHYSGQVQGVGFRYMTLSLARGFEVSGYVRNLPDARVLMEVEGDQQEVNAFMAAIEARMGGFVRHVERVSELRAPQFSGFTVR
jgi:acylphosphatase